MSRTDGPPAGRREHLWRGGARQRRAGRGHGLAVPHQSGDGRHRGERGRPDAVRARSRPGAVRGSPGTAKVSLVPLDDIVEQLQRSRSDTIETLELLRSSRRQIEEHAKQLEGPGAALEYIDFFLDFFTGAAASLERLSAELPRGLTSAHLDLLRQIASNASIEQRRCLMFRDKWINKPLPDERMR